MCGSSMIPTLTCLLWIGLFILATSGSITFLSRSATAGSIFLLEGAGLPAVGWGCGCRWVGPVDCIAQPEASRMTARVLRIFMFVSFVRALTPAPEFDRRGSSARFFVG